MIPRELVEGVQKMLRAGAPREVVWEFLLARGWSEDDAREVFASLEKEEKKEKVIYKQRVPIREAPKPTHSPLEKEEKKDIKEEVKRTEFPVTKPAFRSLEKGFDVNPPLVVVKKEEEKKDIKPPVQQKTEEKSTIPERPVVVKRNIEKTVNAKELKAREHVKPVQKKQSRFVPHEEEELEKAELFEMEKLSSPFRLLSTALSLVKQRFWNLFFLSFMVSVLYLVLYIIGSYVFTSENVTSAWSSLIESEAGVLTTTSLLVVISMVAGFIGFGLLLWLPAAYVLAFSGRTTNFRNLFIQGFKAGFFFFIALVFYLLFVLSGFVLIVIPGVIFSVWFIFAPIITASERTSPFVALLVSRELVRHHFWDVVLRETFLLIPTLLAAMVLLLLLTPLSLLDSLGDSLGLGIGLIVFIFVSFAAILFFFAYMLFFFAYHVALYKEMRARVQSIKLSHRLARTLPFLLTVPLLLSLAVALYVSSLF